MNNECKAAGGMRIGGGKTKILVPVCSPQIPYDLKWNQIQAATMGPYCYTEY
jgi:hypothetical protein